VSDRHTVVVASADAGLRAQLRLTLGEQRFHLVEAHDTDGAVLAIAASTPRLLVLDLALPGTGALSLARTVRSQPTTAATSTLLLVARGAPTPQDAVGIDATLAVPTSSLSLLRRIESLLAAATG
jgi:DNA-binding response OmpR family regulator